MKFIRIGTSLRIPWHWAHPQDQYRWRLKRDPLLLPRRAGNPAKLVRSSDATARTAADRPTRMLRRPSPTQKGLGQL
jgi:hypothetical protein